MAVTAKVFIDGEVSSENYLASIQGVRDQIQWQGQFDEINVAITSEGGDIAHGLGIYDLLRSYKVPIKTSVLGQCCSAATVIFLAGEERVIYENVVAFMVHQASGGAKGTANQLRTAADFIDDYNDRMSAIYVEKTGATVEQVAEWMAADTFMTAQEALANGFATMIAQPVKAKYTATAPATPTPTVPNASTTTESTPNPNQSEYVMKILKDKYTRINASMQGIMNGQPIVAKKVTTEDGKELDIKTVDGGDNYAEGDEVFIGEDAAADGEYKVGNVTITVKGGKIEGLKSEETADPVTAESTTTVTASGDTVTTTDTDELARLRTENETLKGQVTALQSSVNVVTAKMSILLNDKVSKDPAVPAGKGTITTVSARASVVTDEDEERQKMHEERMNRGKAKAA